MKIMKNILQNKRLFRLVGLIIALFAAKVIPMERAVAMMKVQQERKSEEPKGKCFMYAQDIGDGIWVDNEVAEKCQSIKNMLDDVGREINKIPLPFHLDTIKLGFGVLRKKINVYKLSLDQLISVANAFNFLDVPSDEMATVLAVIKMYIEKNSEIIVSSDVLKALHPDLQKLLMVAPAINHLTDFIRKKDLNGKKRVLLGHPRDVLSVAFSPDGKKMVSGCAGDQGNLILWDVSDLDNITGIPLVGMVGGVNSVAFSSDGKKIISASFDGQTTIIAWEINDNGILMENLDEYPDDFFKPLSSFDEKQVVAISSSNENNLIVWDISYPNIITHQLLVGHPNPVISKAFSPDGKKFASGCAGSEKNLIVWLSLTDEEDLLVHQVMRYNVDQVRLVYQLCLQALEGNTIELPQNSDEQHIFMTLPADMQKLLRNLFFAKSFFPDWW